MLDIQLFRLFTCRTSDNTDAFDKKDVFRLLLPATLSVCATLFAILDWNDRGWDFCFSTISVGIDERWSVSAVKLVTMRRWNCLASVCITCFSNSSPQYWTVIDS
jgi:hypothetical protein